MKVTPSYPTFNTLDDIDLTFEKVSRKIVFENREYRYVNTVFDGEFNKVIYRNKEEKHNIIITMLDDIVEHVIGVYSIGEVDLHAVPTLSQEIKITKVH